MGLDCVRSFQQPRPTWLEAGHAGAVAEVHRGEKRPPQDPARAAEALGCVGRSAWSSHSPGQAHLVLRCPVSPTLLQGSGVLTAATTHVWPLGFWLGLIRIKSVSSVSPLPLGLAPQRSLQTACSALKGSSGFALHRTPGVWSFPWLAGFVDVALPPNTAQC